MELLVIFIALAIIVYQIDRRRHPLKKCPACKGNPGKKMSSLSRGAYGSCSRCGGRGEVNR